MWKEAEQVFRGMDIFIETSFSLDIHPEEEEHFLGLIRQIGTDRVLFGTDSPWADQKTVLQTVQGFYPKTVLQKSNPKRYSAATPQKYLGSAEQARRVWPVFRVAAPIRTKGMVIMEMQPTRKKLITGAAWAGTVIWALLIIVISLLPRRVFITLVDAVAGGIIWLVHTVFDVSLNSTTRLNIFNAAGAALLGFVSYPCFSGTFCAPWV